jgi:hypothetical protein
MSFQFLIDNAAELSVIRRPIVAQTIARSGVVRSVSRGNNTWRFQVTLPNGPAWSDYRQNITALEKLDRIDTGTIQFNNSGLAWFIEYQGDLAAVNAIAVTVPSSGNTVTITSAPALASGYRFRAGDVIQLGSSGKCYMVAQDVAYNSNTITLHRPLIDETAGSVTLRVGPACVWTVQCIQFPDWNLFARDQVGWNGSFVLQEVI